jgi:hypothetical protein
MPTILYSILALLAAGSVATVVCYLTARDGYEDDLGFHPTPSEKSTKRTAISSQSAAT